jgi:hypothetical protein
VILKSIELQRSKIMTVRADEASEEQFPEPRGNRFRKFQDLPRCPDMQARVLEWLVRARKVSQAKSYVNYYIEKTCRSVCECCGDFMGLRAVLAGNVNSIFARFQADELIPDSAKDLSTFESINTWQDYFSRNSNMLTLCLNCSELVSICG